MPRSVRIEFAGAFYHVMARGNRREAVFLDDEDRRLFVRAMGEACAMTGWRVHGWVLLSNHYHLMIETPEPNLVAGMQWLQNTVTRRFNVRHRAWGRVFGDRYKAVAVEGRAPFYYETLLDYIHLNPVRAGLVRVKKARERFGLSMEQPEHGLRGAAEPATEVAGGGGGVGGVWIGGYCGRAAPDGRAARAASGRGGGEAVRDGSIAGRDGCTLQPFAARMVLGEPAFWRTNAETGRGRDQADEVAGLSLERGPADAWSEASGAVVARRIGSGGVGSGRSLETERERSAKGGSGRAFMETDDRFPGVAGREAEDAKRGECESALAARGRSSRQSAAQARIVCGWGDEWVRVERLRRAETVLPPRAPPAQTPSLPVR